MLTSHNPKPKKLITDIQHLDEDASPQESLTLLLTGRTKVTLMI